jgi:ABC-2 type transport system permease protein
LREAAFFGAQVFLSADGYLPSNAGQAFIATIREDDMPAPWTGLGVLGLWVAAALVVVVVVRRRDA